MMSLQTFYVQLITRTPGENVKQDCPEIPVKAADKYEAQAAYAKFCGILATDKPISVLAVSEIPANRKSQADKLAAENRWDCRAS
jgi:hypothetical protein